MPITPSINEVTDDENDVDSCSTTEPALDFSSDLVMELEALHADEFAYLSQKLTSVERRCRRSFVFRALVTVRRYSSFVCMTWVKALWAFVFFPTSTSF